MFHRRILIALAIASTLAACATQPAQPPASVAEAVARNPQLSTLNGLLIRSGLAANLQGAGPFTLFAPSDEAFKAVPAKTLDELAQDKTRLASLLNYHLLPARVAAADVKNGNAKTVQGGNLALARAGDFVTVEDAMVQQADLPAANGVVHIVDRVLTPPKH